MKNLTELQIENLATDGAIPWRLLGQAVGDCLRLQHFNMGGILRSYDEIDAFISSCGFPLRLKSLVIRSSEGQARLKKFRSALRSDRARLMTVLLSGALLKRIGEKSRCWKVSLDVFRKLNTFLTLNEKLLDT